MRIRVRLYADFAEKMTSEVDGEGAAHMEFSDGTRVADVLDHFRIPHEDAFIILLDGRHALPDSPLREGAELSVFPAIVGG